MYFKEKDGLFFLWSTRIILNLYPSCAVYLINFSAGIFSIIKLFPLKTYILDYTFKIIFFTKNVIRAKFMRIHLEQYFRFYI